MNNLEKAFNNSEDIGSFSKKYFLYLSKVLESIESELKSEELMIEPRNNDNLFLLLEMVDQQTPNKQYTV